MKFSPATRYAIRILFELRGLDVPVSTAWIAESTGMSLRTVENIQAVLKQKGITSGIVGARGGLQLARALSEISLGDLVRFFDDGVAFDVCCGEKSNDCPNQADCDIRSVWSGVSAVVQGQLDAISLESILQRYPSLGCEGGFILNRFTD